MGFSGLYIIHNEFTQRVCKVVEEKQLKFDVIHAHDWITFKAAQSLAKICKKPWVAQFHSIEDDRRQERRASSSIKKVEQRQANFRLLKLFLLAVLLGKKVQIFLWI